MHERQNKPLIILLLVAVLVIVAFSLIYSLFGVI